ncbi:MAG: hypothetical protein JXQ93_03220 [Flavobacteriaceae bacterium]
MSKFIDFQDYLRQHGCLNSTQEEKDKLFKMYRKEYMREHHQMRKKQQKLVQIWFEKTEYAVILEEAKKLNLKVTDFIKQVIKAQRNQSYVLPDEKVLCKLIISYKKIGVLINQVAYKVNSKRFADSNDIKAVQELFVKLENATIAHYRPLHLENYIRGEMKKNDRFLDHLQRIIDDFKHLGYANN